MAEGGYDTIAEPIFQKVRAQRLLLEYDDQRSGTFDPLQYLPEDKMVVLGLVSTKSSQLEDMGELKERIREANRFIPLERLALSPQCGFSSSVLGNRLSESDQKRKLSTVVETARAVWGDD
ncbi:vitamin-B12 independent methionine synthase [Acidobacteria bacterium AH-259-D05]|nr:vitamin-B12 independent methionine synthase [Acidobacteria bacterium AH-259-D05]